MLLKSGKTQDSEVELRNYLVNTSILYFLYIGIIYLKLLLQSFYILIWFLYIIEFIIYISASTFFFVYAHKNREQFGSILLYAVLFIMIGYLIEFFINFLFQFGILPMIMLSIKAIASNLSILMGTILLIKHGTNNDDRYLFWAGVLHLGYIVLGLIGALYIINL